MKRFIYFFLLILIAFFCFSDTIIIDYKDGKQQIIDLDQSFLDISNMRFESEVNILFYHGFNKPEYQDFLQEKIDLFNQQQSETRVKVKTYSSFNIEEEIQKAYETGQMPQLIWANSNDILNLIDEGKVVKLEDVISADPNFNESDIYKGLWDGVRYNGEIWGCPFNTACLALLYNKDFFEEANIQPGSLRSWEDFIRAAGRITNEDRFGFSIPLGRNEWTVFSYLPFLWQAGGSLFNKDYTKSTFNSPEGIRALKFWIDLFYTHKSAGFSGLDEGYKLDEFTSKKAAMVINGPWNYGALQLTEDLNYGVLPLPRDKERATVFAGENLYILKSTPEKERISWELIKYLISSEVQAEWAILTNNLPVTRSGAREFKYIKYLYKNDFIKPFVEQLEYGKSRPIIHDYYLISELLGEEIENALLKRKSPAKALEDAAAKIDKVLEEAAKKRKSPGPSATEETQITDEDDENGDLLEID